MALPVPLPIPLPVPSPSLSQSLHCGSQQHQSASPSSLVGICAREPHAESPSLPQSSGAGPREFRLPLWDDVGSLAFRFLDIEIPGREEPPTMGQR